MSYYWFNKKEILQKAKRNYSKENPAEYYLLNKEASSSIYKVIRSVLNFLFVFTIRFHKYKKVLKSTKKHQKALKSTKNR